MNRTILLAAVVAVGLGGCNRDPGTIGSPVPVQGRVTMAGNKPLKDLVVTFYPLDGGRLIGMKLGADGKFAGAALPGKYAWYLSPPDNPRQAAAVNVVPAKYRETDVNRTAALGSGGAVELRVE